MDFSHALAGSIAIGAASFAMWFVTTCIVQGSVASKRYDVSASERWLARAPAGLIRVFAHPLPLGNLEADSWQRLAERHMSNLRVASKANDAVFVVPWVLAIVTVVCGIFQLALIVLTSVPSLPELTLSWGITTFYFLPMVSTHEFRDFRWRARAPFEWQYLTAALWLLNADAVSRRTSAKTTTKLNSYLLWRLEAVLVNRFRQSGRSTAPSSRLARSSWLRMIRPLFDEAALLHLRSGGESVQPSIREWVYKVTTVVVEGGSSKRKKLFSLRRESATTLGTDVILAKHTVPSDGRSLIFAVLLISVSSLILSWLLERLAHPPSFGGLLALLEEDPADAIASLISAAGVVVGLLQAVTAWRPRRHIG